MTRTQALVTIWGAAALLTAPWAIDYTIRRLRRTPNIRISTGRLHP